MGDGAEKILNEAARRKIAVEGVFASDAFCRGQNFRGYPVVNYKEAKARFGAMIVLLAFGTHLSEVMEHVEKIAAEQELYAPDVPVAAGKSGVFDRTYFLQHESEFKASYGMLEDEWSRRVFCNIIDFKISGKIRYLRECESDVCEAQKNILQLTDTENYVDVGAYTGDTIHAFLDYAGNCSSILALEPDARNYRKLCANTAGMTNVTCYPYAASDQNTQVVFAQRGGRNSAASGGAGKTVQAHKLDDLLENKQVSYIKFDVEGMEKEALLGAKKTIGRCKPKLMVSAYHRNGDLFQIPSLIRGMRDDYHVYLRHNPCLPAWDINYYFV